MSGYTQAELFNMQVADIEIIKNAAEIEAHIQQIMRTGSDLFETKHRRKDGTIFDLEVSTTVLQSDNETQLIVFLRDISARKRYEELILQKNNELERLSITDGLTNIANRRHFDEVLTNEYARHARSGAKLSLIIMDIDYFKAFNDYYGHVEGDECLRQIGRVMAVNAAREADLAARYGGEEFVYILPETDSEGAKIIAEKLLHGIRNLAIPHAKSKVSKVVTASLGVVSVTCYNGGSAVDIMTEADKLLYLAKSNGRNRVECLF
jgi:diguanylate cyclase (GGDEF)-like protein